MTQLSKPVRRETLSMARDRGKLLPLVVEINTTYLRIRFRGRPKWLTCTYDQVLTISAKNAAEQIRKDRAEARKQRRKR